MAVAAIVLATVGLLVAAFVHSNSAGAARVAENASRLHWANATLGVSGIVRASLAQAVFFSVDRELGVASEDAAQAALDEASANLATFDTVAANHDINDEFEELGPAIEVFSGSSAKVLALLRASDTGTADEVRTAQVEPAFSHLSDLLGDLQGEMAATIGETEESAGQIALIAQIGVTLLIPAATMLIYWWIVRWRMRERDIRFEARLETERDLNRAKDVLIAGVSHELRTPLTSIYGLSEVLVDNGLADPDTSLEMVNLINVEAGELSRMVEDLLTSSRLDASALSVQIEPVDLKKAIEQVVVPLRRGGLTIEVDCEDIGVQADPLRIRQVIRNLVSNAQRHGGRRVAIRAREQAGWVHLVVADNGDGIPESIEERLFERFANEGRRALLEGSVGLGLAVSRALLERMGGTVRYERVDGWTLFSVRLPTTVDTNQLSRPLAELEVQAAS